ncbi:MAG: hypothetical protein L6R35_002302 [Caloplaca aegaea]|nr:MAG: hypothetical protein L6R35_002302 [Caloplaca aegaea]
MEYFHSPTESLQDKRSSDSSPVESTSSVSSPGAPIPLSDNVQDQKQPKHEQSVVVPDMFSSFMAADPVVNPNYHKVKAKGDAWITKFFDGLLEQLKVTDDQREFSRDVDEYMHMRRGTIGAYPAIALSE